MAESSRQSHCSGERIHCPYHPVAELVEDFHTGDMICGICGLIVGDRIIDPSCEWRIFSEPKEVDPCRIGGAEDIFFQNNLSTIVESGRQYNYKSGSKMDAPTRTLKCGFAEITTMAERINGTQSIVHRAKTLFKQVQSTDNLKYRSIDAVASACLYIACRQEGVARSFKEICAVSVINKKEIGRCFKLILKQLDSAMETLSPETFLSRFCARLCLSNEARKTAEYIADHAMKLSLLNGRSPISVAAACIYMAVQLSQENKTLEEIGSIAGVAVLTISQCYKLLRVSASAILPSAFLDRHGQLAQT